VRTGPAPCRGGGAAHANYNYRGVGSGAMYCPRCERTIKKERLEDLNLELKRKFDKDSIEHGKCPVCDTPLIQLKKEGQ